ncbi:hypothetical protein M758_12G166400 [Ceratodon purpureus]|nr:hypothetical protein M758_12G166400 [Ceratodon purpureus]
MANIVPVPTPASNVILAPTPTTSAVTVVVPSIGKPFKFVLASSKTIAGWFGVTCEDCADDNIWGCYVTKSCWKVVIVALGAIFLFIAILMAIFFLGQIDDLLKYQKQLTEFEKAYPTLAKIMIIPLKKFYKTFTKTYNKTMKSLTRKFGKKPWFKFVVIMPCKCLRGTWTIFQKVLQPICLFSCTASGKIKNCIKETGFFQWASDKALKKAGLRADPKDERAAAKQAKIEEKAAKKQARIDAKEARKEAQREARQARNDAKLDALEDAEEAKRDAEEAAEEARLEAIEAAEEAKREAEEKAIENKASKAPPSSPSVPSPPSGPPPSPVPPITMAPPGIPPTATIPSTMHPTTPTTPPLMSNEQTMMYGVNQTQQYVDPYAAQQYVDPYATQQNVPDPHNGYGTHVEEGTQVQGYGAYGQEQYGIYGNDPGYTQQQGQQQGPYGQDQYGAATFEQQASQQYNYDPNVANAQQYQQQPYTGQQYYN